MRRKERQKPTAMAWMIRELRRLGYSFRLNKKVIKLGLEMEKEQIKRAYVHGLSDDVSISPDEYVNYYYE